MRRRAKPAKAKVEAKLPVARKSPKNEGSTVRVHFYVQAPGALWRMKANVE